MPGCLDHVSTNAGNKLPLLVEEVLVVLPAGFPGRREKTSRLKQSISIRYVRDTESTESHRLEWCGHHHACVPFMIEKRPRDAQRAASSAEVAGHGRSLLSREASTGRDRAV